MLDIAVLGCGLVGSELLKLIISHNAGPVDPRLKIRLKYVLVNDTNKQREYPQFNYIDNIETITTDDSIEVVVEALPKTTLAYEYVLKALEAEKQIVSCNKPMISKYRKDLFNIVEDTKLDVYLNSIISHGEGYSRPLTDKITVKNIANYSHEDLYSFRGGGARETAKDIYLDLLRIIDLKNAKQPVVINNVLSAEESEFIENYLESKVQDSPTEFIKTGLSQNNSKAASKISMEHPFLPLDQDEVTAKVSLLITSTMLDIKKSMEIEFNKNLVLIHSCYNYILAGGFIGLHSDTSDFSGNRREIGDVLEYSAIIYLNDDYEGGEIEFPYMNIKIKPKKGSVVYFRGDEYTYHEVLLVTKGIRKGLVLFFGPPDKISEKNLFI